MSLTARMDVHEIDERLPVAEPVVIYRRVGDGAVLLSSTDEIYYGLNRVGARVWEMLPPVTASLSELCAALREEYPHVELSTIRGDVLDLLRDLAANGLVVPPGDEQAA